MGPSFIIIFSTIYLTDSYKPQTSNKPTIALHSFEITFGLHFQFFVTSETNGDDSEDVFATTPGPDTETNRLGPGAGVEAVFAPSVSATCRAGVMTIRVETQDTFTGAVHARDFRRPACTNLGAGTRTTNLDINLLADRNSNNFCGVFINKVCGY